MKLDRLTKIQTQQLSQLYESDVWYLLKELVDESLNEEGKKIISSVSSVLCGDSSIDSIAINASRLYGKSEGSQIVFKIIEDARKKFEKDRID